MLSDQRQQHVKSGGSGVDSGARHHGAVLIDQCDVVVGL
jgi:hypothetical protein